MLAAGAAFLALLDVTVVNLAIPALTRAYPRSSTTSLTWVITSYATLFAAFLAPSGRLADMLGRRRLFRFAVTGFAVMSAACAASPSVPLLLVARALQGMAGPVLRDTTSGVKEAASRRQQPAGGMRGGYWPIAATSPGPTTTCSRTASDAGSIRRRSGIDTSAGAPPLGCGLFVGA